MPAKHRSDPCRAFNFVVELDGVILGGFSEVSGLSTETHAVDYRQGNAKHSVGLRLPGLRKSGTLTLKRGVANRAVPLQ